MPAYNPGGSEGTSWDTGGNPAPSNPTTSTGTGMMGGQKKFLLFAAIALIAYYKRGYIMSLIR